MTPSEFWPEMVRRLERAEQQARRDRHLVLAHQLRELLALVSARPKGDPDATWLPTMEQAAARHTDPDTSLEAARSISPDAIIKSQRIVLVLLKVHGPMADHELVTWASMSPYHLSPSRTRTARHDMQRAGYVRATKVSRKTRSGRRATVHEITPDGRQALVECHARLSAGTRVSK